ncbi:MAG: hypothetical protein ABIH86_02860 [Planctomycetota bacterium]
MSKNYRIALVFFFLAVVFGLITTAMRQSDASQPTETTTQTDPLPADLPSRAYIPVYLRPLPDLSRTPAIVPIEIERLNDPRYVLTNGLTAVDGPPVVRIEGNIQPDQPEFLVSEKPAETRVRIVWADKPPIASTAPVSSGETAPIRVRLTGRLAAVSSDGRLLTTVESVASGAVVWALYDARRVDG